MIAHGAIPSLLAENQKRAAAFSSPIPAHGRDWPEMPPRRSRRSGSACLPGTPTNARLPRVQVVLNTEQNNLPSPGSPLGQIYGYSYSSLPIQINSLSASVKQPRECAHLLLRRRRLRQTFSQLGETPPCRWPEIDPSMGQCTSFPPCAHQSLAEPLRNRHSQFLRQRGKRACQKHLVRISMRSPPRKPPKKTSFMSRESLFTTTPHWAPQRPKIPVSLHTSTGLFCIPPPRDRHGGRRSWRPDRLPSQSRRKILFKKSSRPPQPPATDSQSLSYAPIIFPSENSEAARSRFSRQAAPRRDGPRST